MNKNYYQCVYNNLSNPIITLDNNNHIIDYNKAASQHFEHLNAIEPTSLLSIEALFYGNKVPKFSTLNTASFPLPFTIPTKNNSYKFTCSRFVYDKGIQFILSGETIESPLLLQLQNQHKQYEIELDFLLENLPIAYFKSQTYNPNTKVLAFDEKWDHVDEEKGFEGKYSKEIDIEAGDYILEINQDKKYFHRKIRIDKE